MGKKVSIVIPVYNVAYYLKRCIDSIINQTYNDIEIILVDDGSTDGSGKICDDYGELDSRINIIHQKNAGLSSARNTGTQKATGDYLMYVDSDDWIDLNAVEVLIKNIQKYKSDIAICGVKLIFNNKMQLLPWYEQDCILTKEEAMKELFYDNIIRSFAWNKMYSKKIYKELKWPEGKIYEDIRIMHYVFEKCNKISITSEYLCNYFQRDNSIDHTLKLNNKLEHIESQLERLDFIKKRYERYEDYYLYKTSIFIANIFLENKFNKEEYKNNKIKIRELNKFVKKCRHKKSVYSLYCKRERITIIIFGMFSYHGIYIFKLFHKILKIKNLFSFLKKEENKFEISNYNNRKIILMGSPEYNNLGDHAIAYATKNFIKNEIKEYDFIEITENNIRKNLKNLKKIVGKKDIILLQGGGNLGDIYPDQELLRKKIIKNFKNKIILMPQTIHSFKTVNYKYYDNVYCFAREKESFNIMKKFFNNVFLVPDIVLYLSRYSSNYNKCKRYNVLLCLRNDKEKNKNISDKYIKELLEKNAHGFMEIDSLAAENVLIDRREIYLKNIFKFFYSSKLVITDRLHGMIFAAITKTPCIVLPNFNHKLTSSYEWINNINYIRYINTLDELEKNINEMLKIEKLDNFNISNLYSSLISKICNENGEQYEK